MQSKLTIVGIFRDGSKMVLVDSARQQYECSTPEELWADMGAILGDKMLPGTVITQEQVEGEDDLLKDACDQVRSIVGENHGKFLGYVAGEMTHKMGPFALRTLRNASGRDRFGLRKRKGSGS